MAAALRALHALHASGYAHRGVWPGAIMRRPRYEDWVLSDFSEAEAIGVISENPCSSGAPSWNSMLVHQHGTCAITQGPPTQGAHVPCR